MIDYFRLEFMQKDLEFFDAFKVLNQLCYINKQLRFSCALQSLKNVESHLNICSRVDLVDQMIRGKTRDFKMFFPGNLTRIENFNSLNQNRWDRL